MLATLQHAPKRRFVRSLVTSRRGAEVAGILKTTTPIADQLHKSGYWQPRSSRNNPAAMQPLDGKRVNIVSDKLCEDIITTIGPSLQRHQGCDLLDISPGAGIWSRALHDAVQPRRHIMMESDKTYTPFLAETMASRPYELIPQSGYVWPELNKVLASHITPHHPQHSKNEQPTYNDTLLVTANLATFPQRMIFSFDSLATMVIYQLLHAIRTSALVQRYGCVRMLLWANDENKYAIIPRSLTSRKRAAFEAEISTDWIHEVAGSDEASILFDRQNLRDDWLNIESTADTLSRMQASNIPIIPSRETRMLKSVLADPDLRSGPLAGRRLPNLQRPFKAELDKLRMENAEDTKSEKRLQMLKYRETYDDRDARIYLSLLQQWETALHTSPSSPAFMQLDADFHEAVDNLKKNPRVEFGTLRDSYHLYRHSPRPVLAWDRRAYEPLTTDPLDFYPNAPVCLLDIQPKPMNPLFRQYGATSNRAGNTSDVLLRLAYQSLSWPIETRAMDTFWPGFASMAGHCPSLRDPTRGGSPLSGHGALTLKCVNEEIWGELIQAWIEWPFRPGYEALLGRFMEDPDQVGEEEVEVLSGGMGSAF